MKLNRIIFVVLIAVFLMPNIIAQETKAAFEEDFNGFAVGAQPAGMDPRETDSTGKVRVQAVPSDEDKSLLLENTVVSDSQAFIQKQLSAALSGSVEINFRMMVESTTKRLTLPMLRDGGNNNCTLLNLEPSGKRSVGKVALEDYTFGAWEDYRIAIDFSSKSFNFYINGKKAAEGVALPANLENLILIRFQIQNVIAKVYLDNISIYQGDSGERAEVAPPPEQSGESVFFTEGFDGYATGDKPALPLASRVVGDAAAAVLEEPDARNTSLVLRSGGPDSTAYVQYEFPSVQREAFTVDFKLMLPSAQNLRLPILMDGKETQTAVMDIRANQLIIGESQAASLETGKWYQVKITVQPAQKKYSLSLDGEQIVRGAALSGQLTEVKRLRFQAAQNEQMFYLDELTAASGSAQSVQTYPSALFLTAAQ